MIKILNETTIIILTDIGFSKRDYERFGIEILGKKHQVEILDLTEWLSPNYWKVYPEKIFKCLGYKKILNYNDLEKAISSKKIINVVDYLSSEEAYSILNYIKKRKLSLTKVLSGFLLENKRTPWEFLHKLFFLCFKPKILFKKMIARLKKNIFFSFYDYLVVGGEKEMNNFLIKKAKKVIKSHSLDYDLFLSLKEKKISINPKPYAVFLDQNIPFHPGAVFRGEKPKTTKEKYFPALNNFFTLFEQKTGLEVIFAAHPRSQYDLYPEFLYGRKHFVLKTPELIKDSKVVLLHTSTALSFAILFNKPIIFLTSNEYQKSYDDFRINSYSRSMNSLLFNIDDKNLNSKIPNNNKIYSFDKAKYEEYKNNYIKFPETPEKNSWDIFLDNIIN